MSYFDRILDEAMAGVAAPTKSRSKLSKLSKDKQQANKNEEEKKPQEPFDEREANRVLNALVRNKYDSALHQEYHKLEKEHPQEFAEWLRKNQGNPDYKEALHEVASSGDPLILWMLKYLIRKAESG